jgi:glycosyltransferase involved in cell wall biosynthesis
VSRPIRITHVFRAPAGGLFRHVRDLVRGQSETGHEVGIVCDARSGGAAAEAALAALEQRCALGIHRLKIERLPGLSDLRAAREVSRICAPHRPDILHGHGAKGGLYARLGGRILAVPAVYTPHGGSLHHAWATPKGAAYLAAEKLLLRRGQGLLFVCEFERRLFEQKIGLGGLPFKVVHNGLWPGEFEAAAPNPDATDILFIGELRELKGVGDLLAALAALSSWRPLTATIVGEGPDRQQFEKQAKILGLADRIKFTGQMPARGAFALGRLLVVPSHAESFPYIVLEAAAAQVPMIATSVGGIPEVLPSEILVVPRDPAALAARIRNRLQRLENAAQSAADLAREMRYRFDASAMCANIMSFYEKIAAPIRATGLTHP